MSAINTPPFDLQSKRAVNFADGREPQDAVNLRQMEAYVGTSMESAYWFGTEAEYDELPGDKLTNDVKHYIEAE